MRPGSEGLKHGELTERILGVYYDVYNELGPGFLESVYRQSMAIALSEAGLMVEQEVKIPVFFRGRPVGDFRADMLVNRGVLLELKTAKALDLEHQAQLMHYLKATEIEVGLLLNFGPHVQFKRIVFANERKRVREDPRKSAVAGLS